ncbi:uncharacterized protein LOC126768706 isoform X2 [Nymphalis io]|uniref:uncharacterized protein LOC126768706 isoform X2 n=1 Tax=Inachis io TaxID=171585 RepID=UPI0021674757|nr:uncharacterized protein LOC126768706 isoform X2 [Nymphalis io]
MRCIVFYFIILHLCSADLSDIYRGKAKLRQADGMEFDSISRATLLQKLAAFEENIQNRLASVISLASPVGCVLCGYLIDKFGRRTMIIYSQLPVCIGWVYTGVANSAKHIILGRIITGVGLGMVMCVPRVYMTEVSLPNMRGVIGSFPNIAMSVGIAMQEELAALLRRSSLKPFFLMTIYGVISQLSGASVIFMWTIDILEV